MRSLAGPVNEISVTRMKIFRYEHSSPVIGTKLFTQKRIYLKWHSFRLIGISTLGVSESALVVKLQESTKL